MALLDRESPPEPGDQGFAALHDPSRREVLTTAGDWEIRWPPGPGFGSRWVLVGLWHLQLWHPRRGVSVLVSHQSRWMDHHEIFVPEVGRRITRSKAELHVLLDAHALARPNLDRVHRVAALGYDRAVTALSASVATTMRCPVHRAHIASC